MENEYFTKLAEEIDKKYPRMDQDFILYYLLSNYIEDCENELDQRNYEPQDISDLATRIMMANHAKVAKEMRDVLAGNLW